MANRYPLILDTTDGNKIKELPEGDNLYLRNSSIAEVQNINSLGTINAAAITVNGESVLSAYFLGLSDTPASYSGAANTLVKVNSSGTGLVFAPFTDFGDITLDNVTVTGSILPDATNSLNVGSQGNRFSEMYASSFIGSLRGDDGTLVFDGTTNEISYAAIFGAPTDLGDFTNDAGYITSADATLTADLDANGNSAINIISITGELNGSDIEIISSSSINFRTDSENENNLFEFMSDGTFYTSKNTINGRSYISTPRNDATGIMNITSANEVIITANEDSAQEWTFAVDGRITFPDGQVQSDAYSGGQGHMFMIDTNRGDSYTEVGNSDKPFKTFAAAIAAADAIDTTVTFVLMGCTVEENVSFANTSFTQITIATSCRSVINGDIIITDVPSMSQMFFRNIEVAGTLTITGDGTLNQFNSVNFYNTSFSGPVNITATNATAFYEVAFFNTVDFINLSYLYINGAQFNADWTITADDTGAYSIPSRGINPFVDGGGVSIVFGTIANNVYFVKGGTAAYVFQPHMTRIGRTTESYTIPAGWIVSAYGADFRGTWTNNGSMGMKLSGTDNRVLGTAPSYSSIIGGDRVIADLAPASSKGVAGDRNGMIAVAGGYLYVCTADYTTGAADIWTRTVLTTGTW